MSASHAVLLLALAFAANASAADVYRCVSDGRTTFSDRPCAANAERISAAPNGVGSGEKPDALRAKAGAYTERRAASQAAQAQADAAAAEWQARRAFEERTLAEAAALRAVIEKQVNPPGAGVVIPYYGGYRPPGRGDGRKGR